MSAACHLRAGALGGFWRVLCGCGACDALWSGAFQVLEDRCSIVICSEVEGVRYTRGVVVGRPWISWVACVASM
eukprot:5040405-Prymnesium_polylepis.1